MNSNDDRGGNAPNEINASPLALAPGSAFFAAPYSGWEDGWWGPAKTREDAIRDMLSTWDYAPLKSCVTAEGFMVTPDAYPELFEDDHCMSEWDYQVERPYTEHALPLPNGKGEPTPPLAHDLSKPGENP